MFIHFDRFDVTRGAVGCLCITIDVFNDPLVTDFGIVFAFTVDNCIVVTSTIVIVISKEAGLVRIRPIVMTTLAMILGMVPTAVATGAGTEMRAPMGQAVIGGLITSTLLTLFVVPIMYTILDDLKRKIHKIFHRKSSKVEVDEESKLTL